MPEAQLIYFRYFIFGYSIFYSDVLFQIALNAALTEERSKTPRTNEIFALPPPKEDREKELTSMIHDMENKHGEMFSSVSLL